MKKVLIIFTAFLLITATSSSCSGGENKNGENTEQNNESGTYQCPMKCEGEKTYKQPGKCPVCKMDLKELEDHSAHEGQNDHENHEQ